MKTISIANRVGIAAAAFAAALVLAQLMPAEARGGGGAVVVTAAAVSTVAASAAAAFMAAACWAPAVLASAAPMVVLAAVCTAMALAGFVVRVLAETAWADVTVSAAGGVAHGDRTGATTITAIPYPTPMATLNPMRRDTGTTARTLRATTPMSSNAT